MAETWVVDGQNLSQFAFDIMTWDGLDVTPDMKGDDVDVPQRNGVIPVTNYFQAGQKFVTMIVSTADPNTGVVPTTIAGQRTNFDKNLDSLLKIFYRRKLLNIVRTLSDGVTVRTAQVKCVTGIQPTTLGLASAQVTFGLVLPYSFWRDQNNVTQNLAVAATGAQLRFNTFDTASAPMSDLVYQINGPITNPKITDLETGAWVQYTGAAISAGQSISLDAGAMTVAGGGGYAAAIANVSHGGDPRWLTLVPSVDGSFLQVDGAGIAAGCSLTVTGKRAYLR